VPAAGVEIGQLAPDFRATNTRSEPVSLAGFRGRYLVLYFFPKAFTPGCTREARRFRDNYPEIRSLGGEVLGVSIDEPDVQCEFAEREKTSFPLVADHDGSISRAYGVKRRLLPLDRRVTFVIDPEGIVRARFEHEFQVNRHLDDVLRFLRDATR
jgi:peroxiredoxin Q/BCP